VPSLPSGFRPEPSRSLRVAALAAALVGSLALGAAGPVQAVPAGDGIPTDQPVSSAAPGDGPQGALDDGTRTTSFNAGWKFRLVNPADITDPSGDYADADDVAYDDSTWRSVSLPHDWSIELDPTPSGTTADAGFYQGGLGWYRKSFTLPENVSDKALSLEFDGVYMDSRVYVNGELAAAHPYGYTGFKVDLTGKVHTDGTTPNVVAVKVQNKLPSSRWYSGSGIYRNTHLVVPTGCTSPDGGPTSRPLVWRARCRTGTATCGPR
jgi:beta-galactosidase